MACGIRWASTPSTAPIPHPFSSTRPTCCATASWAAHSSSAHPWATSWPSRSASCVFNKVLIANRGEIALRIVRACRELGVGSVAVFSDADGSAPHAREADEAVHIGAAPSRESYLRADKLIEAARRTGAEAIHPGYGFLSEREHFAREVASAGLVFVGPPASAIAAVGNKTAARALAGTANVPVVPGTTDPLRDAKEASEVADRLGYPVLLKASAGGGGKGMRVVRSASEL